MELTKTAKLQIYVSKENKSLLIDSMGAYSKEKNDDRIGAMNLYRMGIEYLIESQSSISGMCGVQSAIPNVTPRKTHRQNVGAVSEPHGSHKHGNLLPCS